MAETHGPAGRVGTLAEIVALFHARHDPATAEAWDRVGLVCGDPDDAVDRVLFAVDPELAVVEEAVGMGAQLLVTHHPLLLSGVHAVSADTARGRVVHRLIRSGIALLAAHTNADNASPGVSDAIAAALGLTDLVPLDPAPGPPMDKHVVMVPRASTQLLIETMAAAGAGRVGDYDRAAFFSAGTGTFRPLSGANPTIGSIGDVEHVQEDALQMVAPRRLRAQVVQAMRGAHPYEEPAFDVIELAAVPGTLGGGRVGTLAEPMRLDEFAGRVAARLPTTAGGVRVAGDPGRLVRRVALCGGSGDSLMAAADRARADVYVTSDLKHHRAGEHLAEGGCALIDVAHWAAESLWLPLAAENLVADATALGLDLTATVSTIRTDPWTFHVGSPTDAR